MRMARISPKLLWMRPYLETSLKHLPPGTVIERLGAWSPASTRGRDCEAAIFQTRKGAPYRIWIHTGYVHSKIDLLALLAHELAHTISWEHTPEHKALEAKLTRIFMQQLKKEGYHSEEQELALV